jgi:hypothetical protein
MNGRFSNQCLLQVIGTAKLLVNRIGIIIAFTIRGEETIDGRINLSD